MKQIAAEIEAEIPAGVGRAVLKEKLQRSATLLQRRSGKTINTAASVGYM